MNFYSRFSDRETLLEKAENDKNGDKIKVNAHLHTPFSFSAFTDINQALDMAVAEGVKVVGINDFFNTNGYNLWAQECNKRNLFPLFNIEFISLNRQDQADNIRVNDPNNPGRTYLSGKGLSFPFKLDEPYLTKLNNLSIESNNHVARMCVKMNTVLDLCKAGFNLSYEDIKNNLTLGSVRERHLAKALRLKVDETRADAKSKLELYQKLFGGNPLKSDINDFAAVENEIRGNLLKAGGSAFVIEDPKAFPDMEEVCQIIVKAGGIPTYPFLADDANGNFTNFEENKEKVAEILKTRGIASIEFITTRNTIDVLEDYSEFFYNKGFIVTFGSEHNTPAMEPIELFAKNGVPLSEKLLEINFKGASVIAAHQYFFATDGAGYIDKNGFAFPEKREMFEKIGKSLIMEA